MFKQLLHISLILGHSINFVDLLGQYYILLSLIYIFMTIGTTQVLVLLLYHQIRKIKNLCYKIDFLGYLYMMKVGLLFYTRKFKD